VPWFSGLCLDGEVAKQYEMEPASTPQQHWGTGGTRVLELDGLGPITIFVGANNSGKSRLMRELFKAQQPLGIKLKSRDAEGAQVDIGKEIPGWITSMNGQLSKGIENDWIVEKERSQIGKYIESLDDRISNSYRPNERQGLQTLKQKILGLGINGEIRGLQQAKRFYIPILRGMRPPLNKPSQDGGHVSDRDLYEQRTLQDYFKDIKGLRVFTDVENLRNIIFTGLALYGNLRRRLLARTQTERQTVRDYEALLSHYFFPGQDVILIPVEEENNDVVHIKIGNNEERPIYDLGDGMQSLIICT